MYALPDATLDQLFREARTHRWWEERSIPDMILREIAELAKMGPTSANSSPGRFVFVVSPQAYNPASQHPSVYVIDGKRVC